ncbi:SPFH domain / Band 7 family protein [Rubripirellula lacrimiformis]|uniref:SPFH domain / Band 7 family protein n=1 Tax=Rubripirellula lacrimiformis TaxID=1930273 RepID=A0A517N6E1_9BACT|nr:SPFH domain-containing protein [Rubripirellula lacrimiformis]QDT02691.1 SPFH domain / Band 7 family protein [Rubripirellula lacrimiformis]
MSLRRGKSLAALAFSSLWMLVALYVGFLWFMCRVYVPDGHSLLLRYKGPLIFNTAGVPEPGRLARAGEIGVLEEMRGPGRHFYNPVYWERTIVPDQIVFPGQIAVVTSKVGTPLPAGDFLVDGDLDGDDRANQKGILRKVFGPGRYRANPYAFEFKIVGREVTNVGRQEKTSGWVEIPTGYVGVVTMQTDNPKMGLAAGTQNDVMQPGLYPVNPKEQQIDIIKVGYRETSIQVSEQKDSQERLTYDEHGEPMAIANTGINFPSNDGFDIQLDFSAIWGVLPVNAADIVRTFGNIQAVEEKVIEPQSESICRNNGSKMGAVELLIGESREEFQTSVSDEFKAVLASKNISLLYGLVRHIYIPKEVREPIQKGYVADELRLTRDEETKTARIEADLREAESRVELEAERTRVDTDRLRASVLAEGEKKAKEIEAGTGKLVAAIDRETAELDAKKTVLLGRAESSAKQISAEATADKFRLAVEAFGSPAAFNKWEFAEQLPQDLELKLFYAGEGTLWTDLDKIQPTLPLKK